MTKEERELRKLERRRRVEEDAKRFPRAFCVDGDLQLICDECERYHLYVRTNDLGHFKPSSFDGDSGWVRAYFSLRDIETLSELVMALSCRLNALIEETNENIDKCAVAKLHKVEGN